MFPTNIWERAATSLSTLSFFSAGLLDFLYVHISYPACWEFTVLTLSANTF